MTPEIASFISGKIGRLQHYDQPKMLESWGSFLRIRVTIDVSKPLPRALNIRTILGDEHIVTFTFKWPPKFCYVCGWIAHISKWCDTRFQPDLLIIVTTHHLVIGSELLVAPNLVPDFPNTVTL
ncbi:UNVERIFIED_CONTAM: hypothetical protein Sradi_4020300 [Sesamum radiatum]|uniref:Zinc knuckle CX2CX4HX4C domain-containing protein n=1 Tax=Sesamum radiatum TaxID=300843 RepID=A0AAW2PLJ4_SESRA